MQMSSELDQNAGMKTRSLTERLASLGFNPEKAELRDLSLLASLVSHLESASLLLQSTRRSLAIREDQIAAMAKQLEASLAFSEAWRSCATRCLQRLSPTLLEQPADLSSIRIETREAAMQDSRTESSVHRFEAAFTAMGDRLSRVETAYSASQAELNEVRRELTSIRTDRDRVAAEAASTSRYLEAIQRDLDGERIARKEATQRATEKDEEVQRVKGELERVCEENGMLQKAMEDFEEELRRKSGRIEEMEGQAKDAAAARLELERAHNEVKSEVAKRIRQIESLEEDLERARELARSHKKKADDLDLEIKESSVKTTLSFLTQDRVQQAETENKENSVKLTLALNQIDQLAHKMTQQENDYQYKEKQLQSIIESLTFQLDMNKENIANLISENQQMKKLFVNIRDSLKFSKKVAIAVSNDTAEARSIIAEACCVQMHDLENKVFILSVENKRLSEEAQTALESNEKLWADFEGLLEECARLRAAQSEPLFTKVIAEYLDEYVYSQNAGRRDSERSLKDQSPVYRHLIRELQSSRDKKDPSKLKQNASAIPKSAEKDHQRSLGKLHPSVTFKTQSQSLKFLETEKKGETVSLELEAERAKTKTELLSVEKHQRANQQKIIRQRVEALAKELADLKKTCRDDRHGDHAVQAKHYRSAGNPGQQGHFRSSPLRHFSN